MATCAVTSIVTSTGSLTTLLNGTTRAPGNPLLTSLISTVTGKVSSFDSKKRSQLVKNIPPILSIKKVCANGSSAPQSASPSAPPGVLSTLVSKLSLVCDLVCETDVLLISAFLVAIIVSCSVRRTPTA